MCLDVKSEFNLVCSIYHYLVDIVSVETGGKLKFLFSSDPDSSNCSRIICVCVWGGGASNKILTLWDNSKLTFIWTLKCLTDFQMF